MVRFLHDTPADEDFFQTHSAVARAISQAVSEDPRIRVVGLLGSWGSGKSTVIKQLARCFADDSKFKNYILFEYDTWLHQNDPPRRAFMEALFGFLPKHGLLVEEKWTKRLQFLKGEAQETITTKTPIFTWKSVLLFYSYVSFAFGAFLIGKVSLDKLTIAQPPRLLIAVFVLGIVCALLAPCALLFLIVWEKFVEKLKHEDRTIVPRLIKKEVEADKTVTSRQPDPTSIEFRSAFADIATSVAGAGKRLVLVLDNIDRLSDEEALAQWSTIRGFFVDSHGDGLTNGPVVIVPVDLTSISRIFVPKDTNPRTSKDFAQSYLDKTFDVVFSVREPALADWRIFFDRSVEATVGDRYSAREIHAARRLYEAFLVTRNKKATPRSIIRLANHIAALALEVSMHVPLPTVLVYALYKDEIEKSIAAFVSGDRDFSNFDASWKLNLASIHFLVERGKAIGPLFRNELAAAISAGEMAAALSYLESVEGAGDLLVEIARDPPADSKGEISLGIVAFITELVDQHEVVIHGSGYWRDELNAELLRMFSALLPDQPDIAGLASSLAYLGPLADEKQAQNLVRLGVSMVERAIDRDTFGKPEREAVAAALNELVALCSRGNLPKPVLNGPDDATRSLRRELALYGDTEHWQLVRWVDDMETIQTVLGTMIADVTARALVPPIVSMLRNSPGQELVLSGDKDEEELLRACDQIVRDAEQISALPVALKTIALLALDSKKVLDLIQTWSDDGVLTLRLTEAAAKSNANVTASLLAFGAGTDIYFSIPDPIVWPRELLTVEGAAKIVEPLSHWSVTNQRISIWNAIRKWQNAGPPLEQARARFIKDVNAQDLDIEHLLNNPRTGITGVADSEFLDRIGQTAKFAEVLPKTGLDSLLDLLTIKGVSDGVRRALLVEVRARALQANSDEWKAWLVDGNGIFSHLSAVDALDPLNLTRRHGAALALEMAAVAVVRERAALKRWIQLAAYANTASKDRGTIAILEALPSLGDATKSISVLRALGDVGRYLDNLCAAWVDVLTDIMEHQAGRDWIGDNRRGVRAFIRGLDEPAARALYSSMERLTRSRLEGRRRWAESALSELF